MLSLVVLGLVLMNLKIVRTLQKFQPMVIRIDEIGRAQALAYESLVYQTGIQETNIFLRASVSSITVATARRSTMTSARRCTSSTGNSRGHHSAVQTEKHHQGISLRQPHPGEGYRRAASRDRADGEGTVQSDGRLFRNRIFTADHSVAKRRLYTASFLFSFRITFECRHSDESAGSDHHLFPEDEAFIK